MRLSRRARDNVALLFAVTGGAWAWTLQLWLGWLLGDLACQLQPGDFEIAGVGSAGLWLLLGLATGALAVGALWVSWWLARGGHARDEPAAHGARRFLAILALALNALLLGTIVLGATSPLWVPPCV